MSGTLERAIALAAMAHEGQVDKAGAPHVLHPIRVSAQPVMSCHWRRTTSWHLL
jgi:(p)ppGpp synthase/HD superfamily hydrolase